MAGKPSRSRASVFSRASRVRNVDGRTREARIIRDTTAALVEHLGGQPMVPQQLLIHASAVEPRAAVLPGIAYSRLEMPSVSSSASSASRISARRARRNARSSAV
jgi:hypothetical protein